MEFFKDILNCFTNKQYRGYVFQGFWHTLVITFIAALLGLFIGFIVAIIKILAEHNKKLKVLNVIANIYTTVIRGTPIALQLFIAVFAIFAFPGFDIYAIILCFGINSGAYVSESIRAGINSVDKGQREAGLSLGLGEVKTMIKIVLPQAIKNVIPAIGNEFIALLKETSIISMVGSTPGTLSFDLNYASTQISIKTADYLAPSLVAAGLYLIVVFLITLLIKKLERSMNKNAKHYKA